MSDRGPPATFDAHSPLAQYVYVDNVGILGRSRGEVEAYRDDACNRLDERGLLTHERDEVSQLSDNLGVTLDGRRLQARPTEKRYWRIRRCLQWALGKRTFHGRVLAKLVGHLTFFGLVNRRCFASFHTIYAFCTKYDRSVGVLWETVRHELRGFYGLMPLIYADWERPWSTTVAASDSSGSGFGVCSSTWTLAEVMKCGRSFERDRFRGGLRIRPRESALEDDDLEFDEGLAATWDRPEAPYNHNGFREVPMKQPDVVWATKALGKWKRKEDISVTETRAAVLALRRTVRSRESWHSRHLYLVDNMGVALALERCRSKVFPLLNVVRQWCALSLAANIFPAVRWIPSEFNPADAPSREATSAQYGGFKGARFARAGAMPAAISEEGQGAGEVDEGGLPRRPSYLEVAARACAKRFEGNGVNDTTRCQHGSNDPPRPRQRDHDDERLFRQRGTIA
jgi:hypothetical protein